MAYFSALVTREGETDPLEIQLFDNGRGADLISEDGIYSTYFTNYDGVKGRYTLKCEVILVMTKKLLFLFLRLF